MEQWNFMACKARQKTKGGLWWFTIAHGGVVWPFGPCATCDGHETAVDAVLHYANWIASNIVVCGPRKPGWPKHRCDHDAGRCANEAMFLISIPNWTVPFMRCEEHASIDLLKKEVVELLAFCHRMRDRKEAHGEVATTA